MIKPLCENGCGRRTEVYGCRFCPGCYPVASPMFDQVRRLERDRDRYAEQARALAEEVERLTAGIKAQGEAYQSLIHAGGLMANLAFNLKQQEGQAHAERLDELQLAWDYSRQQLNRALTED